MTDQTGDGCNEHCNSGQASLVGYLALSGFGSASANPTGDLGAVAGMCCVSAMAVQNALVQLSLRDAPTTAVLTTDVTDSRWTSVISCWIEIPTGAGA